MENLTYKDYVLLVKAIETIATDLYKDNKSNVLNDITKNSKYISNYGQFYITVKPQKTVQEIIDKKQEEIAKLQKEIKSLIQQKIMQRTYCKPLLIILTVKGLKVNMQNCKIRGGRV